MKVILYSTNCPKCKILKAKLERAKISYEEVSDIEVMTSKGINNVPVMELEDKLYNFKEAVDWVNKNAD